MSMAPELNPGDWKWIERIAPYTDSRWHGGETGDLERVDEWDKGEEEREHRAGGEKHLLLCHHTINNTEGP